jgi:lipopolysaccharide transport system ATP-binding protein
MRPAIAARGLTKQFPVQRGWDSKAAEFFLALDNLSFDIEPGQAVGIVGSNGAGKSTLLKILARILPPTSGRAELNGRVGSLLEAGAGFHPELSGRDNIFLSGAVLGMKKNEILKRLDEIVDFSGVGEFLDRPVKHYSSGMYLRLAFAVAAHIEPEILLVDELLAVGDAQYQKKCLQRMENLSQNGQTILFVSHSMQAVARLCRSALWIDRGKLRMAGPVAEVIAGYLKEGEAKTGERVWPEGHHAPGDELVRLRRVRVANAEGQTTSSINIGEEFTIEFDYDVAHDGMVLFPAIRLFNEWGTEAIWSTDSGSPLHGKVRPRGRYHCVVRFPRNLLAEGLMSVSVSVASLCPTRFHLSEPEAIHFQAIELLDGTTARGDYADSIGSVVRPLLAWTTESKPSVSFDSFRTPKAGIESRIPTPESSIQGHHDEGAS